MIFTLILSLTAFVQAANLTGTVYEKGSNRKNVLFHWKRVEQKSGPIERATITYTDPAGKIAVQEESETDDGRLKRFHQKQFQLNEEGTVEVRAGKALFSYTKNGKTKTDDESAPENIVVGPTLVEYLQKHRERLLKGEKIEVRYAVLDRLETVGFQLFKVGEEKIDGKDVVQVKMKPTSFIISALVDPVHFKFYTDGLRIVEVVGRTSPKRKVGEKWKDLDAEIHYHWPK